MLDLNLFSCDCMTKCMTNSVEKYYLSYVLYDKLHFVLQNV